MKLLQLSAVFLIVCMTIACDTQNNSSTQHNNAIQDKVYKDQFDAMNKAKQVENVLMDAAQSQREAIDGQTY